MSSNIPALEGPALKILVLPGDGIGPEITDSAVTLLDTLNASHGLDLSLDFYDVGLTSLAAHGTTLREEVYQRIGESDGVILGPVSHYDYPPRTEGGINVSAELRIKLDLFANIRPSRSRTGLSLLRRPMDLVIVRENTEGFYSDRNMYEGSGEFMPTPDLALSVRKITASATERLARRAFDLARTRRRRVAAVHKANVLKLSDALFLRVVREVAAEYPDVELREMIVDATAAALVSRPDEFDVIVTTNMFGDILSDEAAELSGSLGLAAGLNVGESVAVAQAQHGSAPDIQGLGIANPTSLILSAGMLLDWYGRRAGRQPLIDAAADLETAVDRVLDDPGTRTRDLGGDATTTVFTDAVRAALGTV